MSTSFEVASRVEQQSLHISRLKGLLPLGGSDWSSSFEYNPSKDYAVGMSLVMQGASTDRATATTLVGEKRLPFVMAAAKPPNIPTFNSPTAECLPFSWRQHSCAPSETFNSRTRDHQLN